MSRVSVLGAGSWGTTLSWLAARGGARVMLWTRSEAQRREIAHDRRNRAASAGLRLSEAITPTTSLADALGFSELVLLVLPSAAVREVMREAAPMVTPSHRLVIATKGLEERTRRRMSEVVVEETCLRQLAVLSGPNIAPELQRGLPAASVIATRFPRIDAELRGLLESTRFRLFSSPDVIGVEVSAALKNIVAIAAGIADGLHLGENARALLVTLGLAEIASLGLAAGAQRETFAGLAGIGDLVVTCSSTDSRSHRLGVALARGKALEDELSELGMVSEGVAAARAAREWARDAGLVLPVMEQVAATLFDGVSPNDGLESLLRRPTHHGG